MQDILVYGGPIITLIMGISIIMDAIKRFRSNEQLEIYDSRIALILAIPTVIVSVYAIIVLMVIPVVKFVLG